MRGMVVGEGGRSSGVLLYTEIHQSPPKYTEIHHKASIYLPKYTHN